MYIGGTLLFLNRNQVFQGDWWGCFIQLLKLNLVHTIIKCVYYNLMVLYLIVHGWPVTLFG